MLIRHYLHGDYLEPADRNPTSVVYCGFCDGYCLPDHLYDEHEIEQSFLRLKTSKKVFYSASRRSKRPQEAPNYFEGAREPTS
jgi:hypothetical protein